MIDRNLRRIYDAPMWKSLKNLFAGGGGGDVPPPDEKAETSSAAPSRDASPGATSAPDLTACYAELGLAEGADMGAVRRAWKEGLKQVHMDHYSDDPDTRRRAQDKARRLNGAYRALQAALA